MAQYQDTLPLSTLTPTRRITPGQAPRTLTQNLPSLVGRYRPPSVRWSAVILSAPRGWRKNGSFVFFSLELARAHLVPHTNREARTLNMQSSELAQAESLEREAQMHRDRAMGTSESADQTTRCLLTPCPR